MDKGATILTEERVKEYKKRIAKAVKDISVEEWMPEGKAIEAARVAAYRTDMYFHNFGT